MAAFEFELEANLFTLQIYVRKFIHDSYANRAGKGTHRALDRCTHYLRRYRYVLPLDVRQFFPSIDHALLLDILRQTLAVDRVRVLQPAFALSKRCTRPWNGATVCSQPLNSACWQEYRSLQVAGQPKTPKPCVLARGKTASCRTRCSPCSLSSFTNRW